MVTFVIEHLEEEFYEWCQYGKIAGKVLYLSMYNWMYLCAVCI